jgi:hypothetical protein
LLVAVPGNASRATTPISIINAKRPGSASRPGSGWGRRTLTPRSSSDLGLTSTVTQDADSGSFSSVWYRLACHLHYNLGRQHAQAGHSKALKHLNKAMSMLRSLSPPTRAKQSFNRSKAPLRPCCWSSPLANSITSLRHHPPIDQALALHCIVIAQSQLRLPLQIHLTRTRMKT